jgi:hypothetical protein
VDDIKRLGRAIAFVHEHEPMINSPLVRAEIEVLLLTGRAMDFAARLRGHHNLLPLTGDIVRKYASFAGLGPRELNQAVLPALRAAGILDYQVDQSGNVAYVDEYVGVSASLLEQTVQLLWKLQPARADFAFLYSVEIGAIAPLIETQHLDELTKRQLSPQEAETALRLTRAAKINLSVSSTELNEIVIFSPYVWGNQSIQLASFLNNLPPAERDALLGLSQQILMRPGISLQQLNGSPTAILSARKSGLIQEASVHSATGRKSTYVFSPLLEAEDNSLVTTEALHQRKLFVAHILFGKEQATPGRGVIDNPAVLVQKLIRNHQVGPATNIGTDYHLLEAAGIVSVRPSGYGDRAYLQLVKPEIAEAGLEWLRRIEDATGTDTIKLRQTPAEFSSPEQERTNAPDDGAAIELIRATVLQLRQETQRAARRDDPWA